MRVHSIRSKAIPVGVQLKGRYTRKIITYSIYIYKRQAVNKNYNWSCICQVIQILLSYFAFRLRIMGLTLEAPIIAGTALILTLILGAP